MRAGGGALALKGRGRHAPGEAFGELEDARHAGACITGVMPPPNVELLWWEGCPSWEQALEDLRDAMADVGLDPRDVIVREVGDKAGAEEERFVGSPTIRIEGRDLPPPEKGEAPALTCRVYHLRDGRVSPVPDPADLRDALARVAARA